MLSNTEIIEKYMQNFSEEKMVEIDEDLIKVVKLIQQEAQQSYQEHLEKDKKQAEEENKMALDKFLKEANTQPQQIQQNIQTCMEVNLSKIQELNEEDPDSCEKDHSFLNEALSDKNIITLQGQHQMSQNDFMEILKMVQLDEQQKQIQDQGNVMQNRQNSVASQLLQNFHEQESFTNNRNIKSNETPSFQENLEVSPESQKSNQNQKQNSFITKAKNQGKNSNISFSLQQITFEDDKKENLLFSPQGDLELIRKISDLECFDIKKENPFCKEEITDNKPLQTPKKKDHNQKNKPQEKTIHDILQEQFDQFRKQDEEKKKEKNKKKKQTQNQNVNSEDQSLESSESDENSSDIIEEEELQRLMQNRRKAIFGELTPDKRQ